MGKKAVPKKAKPAKSLKRAKPTRKSVAQKDKKPVAKAKRSRKEKPVKEVNPPQVQEKGPLVRIVGQPARRAKMPDVVSGGRSTLEPGNRNCFSPEELQEFKGIIEQKLQEARNDYKLLKETLANTSSNGTENTDSASLKLIEDGSETLSREETAQLASRQEKFIKNLEDALLRIRYKTYGICRATGKLISKERLRLVPHATLSVEGKQKDDGHHKGSVTGKPVRAKSQSIAA